MGALLIVDTEGTNSQRSVRFKEIFTCGRASSEALVEVALDTKENRIIPQPFI